jgi:hypothetical protein
MRRELAHLTQTVAVHSMTQSKPAIGPNCVVGEVTFADNLPGKAHIFNEGLGWRPRIEVSKDCPYFGVTLDIRNVEPWVLPTFADAQ